MNCKERVMAALRGETVDRVPMSFWRHFSGEDAQGIQCVRKHVAFYRQTHMDFIKIMHDGLIAPCSLEVQSLDDLRAYRVKGRNNPYILQFLERAKGVADEIGEEVYLYANIFAPFTLLRRIGDEKLRQFIREDKRTVLNALDVLAEELALLCGLLVKEAGCLGVFAAFQGAERNRFLPEEFRELVYPSDQKLLSAANEASPYNILHFCGWDEVPNQLELWREYQGCAVNWATYVEGLPLEKGRGYFGGRPVLGGFDNRRGRVLYQGSREEIIRETERLLSAYRRENGGIEGLILGADCSFLTDFELCRFDWVFEALQ